MGSGVVAAAVQYGYGTQRDESRSRSGGVIVGLLPNDDDNRALDGWTMGAGWEGVIFLGDVL